jgi:hypothetical protein
VDLAPSEPTEEPVTTVVIPADWEIPPIIARLVPVVAEYVPDTLLRKLIKLARGIAWATEWVFGVGALILGLAILATIPVLQLLSLGYLLEVTGRVARTGRLRDGFVGVRKAARVGSIVFCTWVLLWPLRFISELRIDAGLFVPTGTSFSMLTALLTILSIAVGLHVIAACLRGGKLRHFLWPGPIKFLKLTFGRGSYARARDGVWDFVTSLRLPHYFWLGLRGFVGGLLWLVIPVSLLAAGHAVPLLGILGGLLMALVVMNLPLLQARFAAENRFKAMFDVWGAWRCYFRAPVAYWIALTLTLLMALPLYALKIEIIPREAAMLPALLFVMSAFPARLALGWACGRAGNRETARHWFFGVTALAAMLPVAAFYALIVFFTRYTSWHGIWSLYEQHAFLVPVPFLSM